MNGSMKLMESFFHSVKCRYFAEILNIAVFHHSNSRQGCGGRGKECEENQMECHLAQLQATQKETELAGNCGSQEIKRDGNWVNVFQERGSQVFCCSKKNPYVCLVFSVFFCFKGKDV